MRSISKLIMMLALILVSGLVYGQQAEDKTLLQTEKMAARLGLNDAQKAQLDKQLKEAQAERQAQMQKLRAFQEEMKRDAFVARQQRKAELKNILTPEQWEEYEKMKSQRMKQLKARKSGQMRQKLRSRGQAGRLQRLKQAKEKAGDGGND